MGEPLMSLTRGTVPTLPLPPAHSSARGNHVIHPWTLTVAKGTTQFSMPVSF